MNEKPKKFSIKEWPEGERPREKLIQFGADTLTDAELLAIILEKGTKEDICVYMSCPWQTLKNRGHRGPSQPSPFVY